MSLIDRLRGAEALSVSPSLAPSASPVVDWGADAEWQLRSILLHTIVCFADARWEVRPLHSFHALLTALLTVARLCYGCVYN